MKRYTFFCVSCALFLFSALNVHGQGFPGFGPVGRSNRAQGQPFMASRVITVNEAKDLPNDSWVILAGNIVNALPGDRYYTLRDASGEIVIGIDLRVWRGLSFNMSDRVEIRGVLIKNGRQVFVNAGFISVSGRTDAAGHTVTASEAKELPHYSWVILQGFISAQPVQGNRFYAFRDSSGEIAVAIDRRAWRSLSAGYTDRVEICGELMANRRQVFINVRAIREINGSGR